MVTPGLQRSVLLRSS